MYDMVMAKVYSVHFLDRPICTLDESKDIKLVLPQEAWRVRGRPLDMIRRTQEDIWLKNMDMLKLVETMVISHKLYCV